MSKAWGKRSKHAPKTLIAQEILLFLRLWQVLFKVVVDVLTVRQTEIERERDRKKGRQVDRAEAKKNKAVLYTERGGKHVVLQITGQISEWQEIQT